VFCTTQGLERVERELSKRYGADYQVACENSAETGLQRLGELKASGEDLALVLADQRMPGMKGIDFLSRAHQVYPLAKRLLLIDPRLTRVTGAGGEQARTPCAAGSNIRAHRDR
jgi:CheY-like chemotaxis protein